MNDCLFVIVWPATPPQSENVGKWVSSIKASQAAFGFIFLSLSMTLEISLKSTFSGALHPIRTTYWK
jgi:hypothetical protein